MPAIRPISDLRNHFTEITNDVQKTNKPVFLTKNGVGTLVVMSMENYEQNLYEAEVYDKLKEAELQAATTKKRISHSEMMIAARKHLSSSGVANV